MRSAESWIGVSGFLISWAMRRATSAQAVERWAMMFECGADYFRETRTPRTASGLGRGMMSNFRVV